MNQTVRIPDDHRVLHRLIMPEDPMADTLPLYVESVAAGAAALASTGSALGEVGPQKKAEQTPMAPGAAVAEDFDLSEHRSRFGATIPAAGSRSFGTYFNAFPASYWRRWTPVREITLTIQTEGDGQIVVNRSNAKGAQQRVDAVAVTGRRTTRVPLKLDAFGDGGWYWFDAFAGAQGLRILGAAYSADASLAKRRGTFSIGMTTMNKVEYCLDNIRTLLRQDDLLELMDVMYVIDQGSDRLTDHAEQLTPLQEGMGEKLRIIEQGNIGGSGGFSRGMYEASTNGRSDYVINCDDDIVIEPESFHRVLTFADFCTRPTLVGGHMFDLNNRSSLHTFGEVVDPWRTQPAAPNEEMELSYNLASYPLRATPWLHRRVDVDYNGWWMTLIPTEVVREIGLSLPVFIKWDDAEYGLRAKKAGYPTVSLPGAAVWHVAWGDKDDLVGWQAFFHERNRIITALLHSPYENGGRVTKESQFLDIKHVFSMQYFTQMGRALAQRAILDGPDALHQNIGTILPEIRSKTGDYADSRPKKNIDDFPAVVPGKPPRKGRPLTQPRRAALPLWAAKQLVRQTLVKPSEKAQKNPQAAIAHQDARWWRLTRYDSALVSNAEGTQVFWYQRDPKEAVKALGESVRVHADLTRRWKELSRAFQDAAPRITSFEEWEKTFAANPAPQREDKNSAGADR
ncbi:glycosyltransferase [Helcobacillus sp. ACRRO]|uniref:glycosyltransferase n=1 Tax=Helcobacillus TaxID=1161125 RepID=UPI001EF48C7F|nr:MULTISPECIES: glycosyltransferase [Helcobacillus]MCG7426865.1 glycosyltransferase [Helcobacillus sp. ACRRO]MDK7742240.1 glycosyltransferase [Helcobacillus massiliensis]WOO93493.1 glycosyltransferase [Helcobacillus massiliensis]